MFFFVFWEFVPCNASILVHLNLIGGVFFQVKFLAETLNFSLFTLDIHGGITDVPSSEQELDWWRGGICGTLERCEILDMRYEI